MDNIWQIRETHELIGAVERIKKPEKYLSNLFFPNHLTSLSDVVTLEYLKGNRRLAPYVVRGGRPLNMARDKSRVRMYKAPMIGAKRIIGLEDISGRIFGEQPIYSSKTPEDRAAEMQARDLTELMATLENRREQMAAELLTTGKLTVKGYADDGQVIEADTIEFTSGVPTTVNTSWDNAGAKIYDDLKAVSDTIQEDAGLVPTVMICGGNVESYMLNNTEMKTWFDISSRENLKMVSFEPHYTSPQARYIGTLNALNLEIYNYGATYLDDDGQVKPFIPADHVIIGVPSRGKFLFGAVTYLDSTGSWQTAAAENIPVYNFNVESQATSLTVYSRCLPMPEVIDDFICLKVK